MAASGPKIIIDPTKNTKYPVILSDALLGKASKETYTGVRYNYRPTLSSETSPTTARIKQSARDGTFNLGIEDKGERWQYNGQRTSGDDKYVLVFDSVRKAFVLHRVDSMFHMNVTRTPSTTDVEKLREEFPKLEVDKKHVVASSKKGQAQEKASDKASGASGVLKKPPKKEAGVFAKPARKAAAAAAPLDNKAKKAREAMPPPPPPNKKKEAQKKAEPVALAMPSLDSKPAKLPAPKKEEKKPKRQSADPESEEDDDDDDDPLQIEYPEGSVPPKPAFSPDFLPRGGMPIVRRFSEFVRDHQQEDDDVQDADAEYDAFNFEEAEEEDEDLEMEDVQSFKLPSPVNHGNQPQNEDTHAAYGQTQSEVDLDADLEAELERELGGLDGNDSESSVSEED